MMSTSSNVIEGKVVVITGASSGLGEATARLLSAQGSSVVLGARRLERLQALADELTSRGGKALAIATEVTDPDQVQRLVDAAVETHGRIDVMLNNAGLMPHSPLERRKIDDWNRTIDVSIKGVLYGIAAALPASITEPDVAASIDAYYQANAIPVDSFARAVAFAMSQPEDVDINEILFRPTRQEL